jgi:uncharacterized protein YcfJ
MLRRYRMEAKQGVRAGVLVLALAVVLGGCSQPLNKREKGVLVGGGLGAASGALIGAAVGAPGAGATIGGAMGALGGGIVGDQLQGQENRQYYQQRQLERQNRELQRQRKELEQLKRKSRRNDE